MKNSWDNATEAMLNTEAGQQLLKNKKAISEIAASGDGQRVKSMLEQNAAVSSAMESGNMQALSQAISGILKTEEGARLAAQLSSIMHKQGE